MQHVEEFSAIPVCRLGVIIASVRDGRNGLPVAEWFTEAARKHGAFDVSVMDLKAWDLPLLSEPNHPRLKKYTQEKTKRWSAAVEGTDAFVIVTPEYNFASPPALVNALHHVYHEWNYKAAGFVSYGGISGGLRSVQMTKSLLTTLKIVPIVEAVTIPFIARLVESGRFKADEKHEKSAAAMLDELARWTKALGDLRRQ
jgi:NAD(P)H-dependent FMN reductase